MFLSDAGGRKQSLCYSVNIIKGLSNETWKIQTCVELCTAALFWTSTHIILTIDFATQTTVTAKPFIQYRVKGNKGVLSKYYWNSEYNIIIQVKSETKFLWLITLSLSMKINCNI